MTHSNSRTFVLPYFLNSYFGLRLLQNLSGDDDRPAYEFMQLSGHGLSTRGCNIHVSQTSPSAKNMFENTICKNQTLAENDESYRMWLNFASVDEIYTGLGLMRFFLLK